VTSFLNSQEIRYISEQDIHFVVFGLVKATLDVDSKTEPLPDYRKEDKGNMAQFVEFIKNDAYYPTLIDKAAYLFTTINKRHLFSNGNKRLAFMVLLYFMDDLNGYEYVVPATGFKLKDVAFYIADKERNNNASFDKLKEYVADYIRENFVKK
jgi:death-on-curing protein